MNQMLVNSTDLIYQPEENPFQTLIIDVTHRCNMQCKNCYIPNREIPDMDKEWLYGILKRLPSRTRIRLIGAEPTMREDLPEIISNIRKLKHLPILVTNGLKLSNLSYLKKLKESGLRSVYLSFSGGFDESAYLAIDDMQCAKPKIRALENLLAENMYITLGMILVRGINELQVEKVFQYVQNVRQIYELHIRSVGKLGRYMQTESCTLDEMIQMVARVLGVSREWIYSQRENVSYVDFKVGKLKIQLTEWPDFGSDRRGRLSPDGTIQRFFEHVIANEGGY